MLPPPPAEPVAETVSQFTRRLKLFLEQGMRAAWVRGEVSNFRAQASGHGYFSLKDGGAQVKAVFFRGDALRSRVALRDGMQVVVYGEVSVYEARGEYQLVVRTVAEDGVGRLQQEFEALKLKLAGEGLFAAERKRPLPQLPRVVGFVTSPTGAAVQDFIRILRRRQWRGRVVILPARVQGDGAAEEITALVEWAGREKIFDLLVVGRGGGSAEDLWAFNSEALVRAIAACPVPVISAVGHEIDFTLSDFVADVRAETPSAAAELISSHFVAALERAGQLAGRLIEVMEDAVASRRRLALHAGARLRLLAPAAQIERGWLRMDDLENRAAAAVRAGLSHAVRRLTQLHHRYERVAPERRMELAAHRVDALRQRLVSASPRSVLNRGYVIMRHADGKPVSRRAELALPESLTAEFADGSVDVTAK
jgi:exodeoxyribonuclease VII large subunit